MHWWSARRRHHGVHAVLSTRDATLRDITCHRRSKAVGFFFLRFCTDHYIPYAAMSRLIVKGLPPYLTDVRLRDHFAQKGTVTDVKLMKRPDGTSRRFGFVGYRTDAEAQAARAYFDRTYIDTSRISVAIARQVNDEELQAQKMRRSAPAPRTEEPKEKLSAKSASFDEFLSVMAPKHKRKAWMNNEDLDSAPAAPPVPESPASKKRKAERTTAAQDADVPLAVAPNDHVAEDEELDDLEYMRRRMRHKIAGADEPKAFEQSDDEADADEDEAEENLPAERRRADLVAAQRKDEENIDTIMQSGRLFVRNLPFTATEDEVAAFFASFGPVEQVRIYTSSGDKDDLQNRDSRGIRHCGGKSGNKDSRCI